MKIAVVGLGLIGGSLCKAIKKRTSYTCLGLDTDAETCRMALEQEAVDEIIAPAGLAAADVVFLCLHPRQTIEFLLAHLGDTRPGALLLDTCGVKGAVVDAVDRPVHEAGRLFVGCHPMAGREFSGFAYAVDDLFERASFIVTPTALTDPAALEQAERLAMEIGFARTVRAAPETHDRIIAFTSQLAHVASSAYVKSPTIERRAGFSAGSFLDLTRVARLNEDMWTDLFLYNRDALLAEVDTLIAHLGEYRDALKDNDADRLRALLRDGRERKERSLDEQGGF
ncbi:prephenate dehydrogenase [Feifania hominis]|uniref:Prephenate dehydrogenase n=1 Tax=Feifania hominis TaxID=2763660 RepID=A0A926DEA9_9FIRM|nr:prephenate dehydrogenase [Feifania hominis]MBC8536533.1 prephenate dehydrogenase [Feifania hominis]